MIKLTTEHGDLYTHYTHIYAVEYDHLTCKVSVSLQNGCSWTVKESLEEVLVMSHNME